MKIIGFGQQMMLDGVGRIQHEISVELADGSVHVLPTSEETVQKLISLYQGKPEKHTPRVVERPPQTFVRDDSFDTPQMDAPDEETFEDDPGEMTPAPRRSVPTFLAEDEDGSQV